MKQTEKDGKRLFPEDIWNKIHVQIIYYGREYSPSRSPKISVDFITRTIGSKKILKDFKD